ncbi:MAG: serine hydrolase domain-containing protein [Henriciella sp.]|uniref:serine hydrolase domain-containing protein n=1 Tax=Henriciella sp. TaxID=1968823 RepID=UPI003C77D42B
MKALSLVFSFLFLAAQAASAQQLDQEWLQSTVDEAFSEYEPVALGAAVARLEGGVIVAVAGMTRKGSDAPAEPDQAWHIGSNTKALTALLYARLVDAGEADWGASVADLFEGHVETIDPAWTDITIEDLFAHRSGVGQLGPGWLIARHADSKSLPQQRLETVERLLDAPPPSPTGAFEYSNLNYIVAGAAIELITGTSWRQAMKDYVFEVEGSDWSDGWGTGAPQTGLQGHRRNLFGFKQSVGRGGGADNPGALGPAGTLHVPLETHARLLLEFVDPASRLITPAMRTRLFAPWPDETAVYAMGWGVQDDAVAGRVYAHAGSNTAWLSRAVLLPEFDAVIVVNSNEFTDASRAATDAVVTSVSQKLAGAD